ncbi:MAG TPA: phosphate ABC transporter permease PstA [Actinocrinis sp.]|uniref:phosphate ABC transporter permease PstA n=1 Tax=Actinocrinis sp. TaxID=1920516 RepID=UPI002DDDB164|nr:phosphate ABC transporter permease PstA [Actinocrinis sp.]HEV2343750.1 phosphate ABC transporter permease PstA [Actinocrinis sp.]
MTDVLPAELGEAPSPAAAAAPQRPAAAAEQRIRLRTFTADGLLALLGSAAAAIGFCWVAYERILPLTGALGFWLLGYLFFLGVYGVVTAIVWGRRAVVDRVVAAVMYSTGLLIVGIILDQIGYTIYRGEPALRHLNFFTQTMAQAGARDPLTVGGVLQAIVGSLMQMGIATAIAVPLGILAALFLAEVGGRMARPVRSLVEAMTSLPEIIAGLFIYALFVLSLGFERSGLAAGLALTVMMIPFVARSSEVMLRLVPQALREASYALGASQWRTVWTVVLPTARSGLTTAVVLGMARAIGETAPVLLTSGVSPFMNTDPLHHWQTSLPLFIYDAVHYPQQSMIDRGFGAALVLIIVVLVLFTIARTVGGKAPGELTRRQRRRIARDLYATSLERASDASA